MTTKIKYVVNQTNETIRFQRLQWLEADETISPHTSVSVDVDIPWCLTHGDFAKSHFIRVSLLQSNRHAILWEARHVVYCGKTYSDNARAVSGDASTEKEKVLYVTPRGLVLKNYNYTYSESDLQAADLGGQEEGEDVLISDVAMGEDELSYQATGWCRIYVRRHSAMGAGHVGFAYAMPDGRWCVGGVENPGGGPIAAPGETGLWAEYVDPSQVSAYFSSKHPLKSPYDAFKSLPVGTINFHAAQQMLAAWFQNPYKLIGMNCSDAVYAILDAYGAPLPGKKLRPNAWYDSISAQSRPLPLIAMENADAAKDVLIEAETLIDDGPLPEDDSGITPLKPDEFSKTDGARWFNSAALPIAGLPWPDVTKTSSGVISNGWSRVNVKGGFAKDTYLFLHSFTGINVVVGRNRSEADGPFVAADPATWIALFTGIVTFIRFVSDTIQHVFRSWVEFADWYSSQDRGSVAEIKDPARRVHVPEPTQDNAKRSVPTVIVPRKPNDTGSNAGDGATLEAFDAYSVAQDGRLVSKFPNRGLQIVLRYKEGGKSRDHWLRLDNSIRNGMVKSQSELGSIPGIKLPDPQNIEAIYVGWFEDPTDHAAGKISAGDMMGVLDFWEQLD